LYDVWKRECGREKIKKRKEMTQRGEYNPSTGILPLANKARLLSIMHKQPNWVSTSI